MFYGLSLNNTITIAEGMIEDTFMYNFLKIHFNFLMISALLLRELIFNIIESTLENLKR